MPKKSRGTLLVGTRKGAFILTGDPARKKWNLEGPHFLGSLTYHVVLDPRDGRTLLAAVRAGHLGPTVYRSRDGGKTWSEAKQPPAFPKKADGSGESVQHVFWLTPGHSSQPGVWYAGTAPHGIFRSDDGGETWGGIAGFNEHPMRPQWRGLEGNDPPDAPNTHSIRVDPRDSRHLYAGFSTGGVFESTDEGETWTPLNKGVDASFLPDPSAEFGHDPHTFALHPLKPDRLYQQNHCGIYRLDRPGTQWERIGRNMPGKVGDIGFPLVLHPRDPETLWVFPMDGTEVWPRTSPDGKPAAYVSRNGGKTWTRQDKGFPRANAWWTVKRQAMAADSGKPLGLYVGNNGGEIWASRNEGARWECIARHLPPVFSVETGARA